MNIIPRLRKGSQQLMEKRLYRAPHPFGRATHHAVTVVYPYIDITYLSNLPPMKPKCKDSPRHSRHWCDQPISKKQNKTESSIKKHSVRLLPLNDPRLQPSQSWNGFLRQTTLTSKQVFHCVRHQSDPSHPGLHVWTHYSVLITRLSLPDSSVKVVIITSLLFIIIMPSGIHPFIPALDLSPNISCVLCPRCQYVILGTHLQNTLWPISTQMCCCPTSCHGRRWRFPGHCSTPSNQLASLIPIKKHPKH